MSDDDSAEIARLREELRKRDKTIKALKERVKRSTSLRGNAYSIFETNIVLKQEVNRQTRKLEEYVTQLDFLASRDSMTGLYNRRRFFELALQEFAHSLNQQLFAAMIDIDYFKRINDCYGHQMGDQVIAGIGKLLADAFLPANTVIGRIGGEEFALVSRSDCFCQSVQDLIKAVRSLSLENGGNTPKVTLSIGLAKQTGNISSLDELLSIADDALYAAKRSGRDCLVSRLA